MNKEILTLTIWISFCFCACVFMAWYFSHKAKHQERMLMIEKGMNPHEIAENQWNFKNGLLKLGIVIIGLSVGLIIISLLVALDCLGKSGALPIAISGICGGSALILANRLNIGKKQ